MRYISAAAEQLALVLALTARGIEGVQIFMHTDIVQHHFLSPVRVPGASCKVTIY